MSCDVASQRNTAKFDVSSVLDQIHGKGGTVVFLYDPFYNAVSKLFVKLFEDNPVRFYKVYKKISINGSTLETVNFCKRYVNIKS